MSRKAGRLVGDLRRMNSGLRETLTIDDSEQEPESRTERAGDDDKQGEGRGRSAARGTGRLSSVEGQPPPRLTRGRGG